MWMWQSVICMQLLVLSNKYFSNGSLAVCVRRPNPQSAMIAAVVPHTNASDERLPATRTKQLPLPKRERSSKVYIKNYPSCTEGVRYPKRHTTMRKMPGDKA